MFRRTFSFVLFSDCPWYGLKGVLEGLERDLEGFRYFGHDHTAWGGGGKYHIHVVGRFPHPISSQYFIDKYNIPDYCISNPVDLDAGLNYLDRHEKGERI